ncbi:hypothetical protein L5515_019066 [Caenorhabditis briggsae]|uniref:Major facilitator superfamily (MFS) profile domain-containing protein n=2 Tax=Caenorhabditis briggsae TaxID=6238 RepID=A0AAE9JV04_CAEBR|nr:hypothetical protein L5515_019066 [Caenorhabditis briggsae]
MNCMLKMNAKEENIRLDGNSVSSDGGEVEKQSTFKFADIRRSLGEDYGLYELRLLFLTQVGYVPVAAAMLLTTFIEPSTQWCETLKKSESAWTTVKHEEFYSISVDHGFSCGASSHENKALVSSLLMWGALIGSFFCGFLSDKIGRKPVWLGCLMMVTIGHFALAFSNHLPWFAVCTAFGTLGFFCGGYMVTNFVILTEGFELAKSRLLAVSFNGWSLSMTVNALVANYTQYYVPFHGVFAAFGVILTVLGVTTCYESCRWLSANGRHREAKKVALQIVAVNDKRAIDEDDIEVLKWFEILGFSEPTHTEERRTWSTLFKSSRLLKPTVLMCYSFFASSIVSFGFYFSLDVLPGNRFWNQGFMGVSKFALGFTPFILNNFTSKRIIAIFSVGVCWICALLIIPVQYSNNEKWHLVYIALSLIISAGIDPTWKINHLYSAELFPTSVRSMARGVCNAGGRFGSVLAPMIVYLNTFNVLISNAVFAVLLFIQLAMIMAFLPNDSDKDADEMNDE